MCICNMYVNTQIHVYMHIYITSICGGGVIVSLSCFTACGKDHQSSLVMPKKLSIPTPHNTTTTCPPSLGEKKDQKKGAGVGTTGASPSVRDLVHQEQPLDPSNHQAAVGDTSQHTMEEVSGAWDTLVTMGMQ